ncbi:MAG: chromate efflux transporter [Acidobacteriota bacterium]|jgi:chromate transporter
MSDASDNDLGDLARLFLKLGMIGFGGPAAHIAMMEDEVVERRGWLTHQRFLDMVGATNLIPGPNSTEMAIHIGWARGGLAGLTIAGSAFILPAVAITTALAWLYVRYGTLPQADPILYGIRPVVVAIVFGALWKLSRKALRRGMLVIIAVAVAAAALFGANEVLALLAGGVIAVLLIPPGSRGRPVASVSPDDGNGAGASHTPVNGGDSGPIAGAALWTTGKLAPTLAPLGAAAQVAGVSLAQLFVYFLTIGSVLYGSGYVLFAFLEGGLVRDYGWLTQQQLIDAVAIGQFTPGPVLSTATFVGYVVAGPAGAVVATLGIFLPSFLFVSLLARILPRLGASPTFRAFLDGVNASAVALMTVVTLRLAIAAFVDWQTVLLGVAAAAAAVWWRVNAAALVLAGAAIGWLLGWI